MKKQHIKLKEEDQKYLEEILSKGELTAKQYKRATALLEMQRGKTLQEIALMLGINYNTVAQYRDKYQKEGLKFMEDLPRPGRPIEIDEIQRAKIIALACSEAPPGKTKWGLRLLAKKVVELGYCEEISHMQVRRILKNPS
ncbi:MAG: helix-turn-helix domain containing protein [Blastocatellia bacterium]|nr:helix-turn-helix domain containing protein [Blastocatellia bacterium]MBL8196700.1 helix-turn-helix domain containing protein [Blastocatellia bacterium]MBN8721845.1 helix-turn-helix domain containing protein [Acidobacteriota bacterium]